MIACPECGAPVDSHRRRCAQCGYALAAADRNPADIAAPGAPVMLGDNDFLPDDSGPGGVAVDADASAASRRPGGVWRQGKLLVMRKGAALPPWCVKSREPTEVTLRRKFTWHHPVLYVLIPIGGLLVYVIVALIVQKKATIDIGLTRQWLSRRRWGIATGWLISLGGVGMMILPAAIGNPDSSMFLVLGGILTALLVGPIYGVLRSRMVAVQRISDEYVWLKGVHPSYLAELREFPGESSALSAMSEL